ncbi:phosphate starvation-inducible protein PhoH [Hwanghaeella grinnelliae]|uniref:PhoH-like protein n=1 Tax=Hwanghaeella grinnelliae TaxID=2500179 RepID=A0A437QQZ0_9PROT|nr:PhoH family protein [Hwanghaeella grinnelliae]RVU36928.1 phosphate starvation-inducible protein PhoH [Hwanghaeella grinnelliae]
MVPTLIQFDDNRLLPLLFGEHDKHLVRIEKSLGVQLINRGNQVTIEGPQDAIDLARVALNRLYQRLKEGEELEPGDVDAAVRMAGSPTDLFGESEPVLRTKRRQIKARSPLQANYMEAMLQDELVFGIGPAGTGKTYLAVCAAVSMLVNGQIDRIVLSRPAVEAGERLGFLPGDMKEKVDPYMRPIYDALYENLPADQVTRKLESGEIEVAPLAFMRGRTLKNAFILLDEAQNTTPVQMKMFLTRLGENSRMVITGDLSQIDLPRGQSSGLADALDTLEGVKGISAIRFSDQDVVRHPLVSRIVKAYDARDKAVPASETSS